MTTDYNHDRVAQEYREAKEQPWRSRIETYSFMNLIGDVHGKSIVDLACGEGYFTRILRLAGASRVVGVDISERMIDLAREREAREPLGLEYRVADAASIVTGESFDLVVAAWLLVYAHDRAELDRLCRGMASWARPGGRLVTVTTNPDVCTFQPTPDYRPYGFELKAPGVVTEGAPILWTIHLANASLEIENYYLPISAYESALQGAGFRDVTIHRPVLEPNPRGDDDSPYWANLLDHPVAILIEAQMA